MLHGFKSYLLQDEKGDPLKVNGVELGKVKRFVLSDTGVIVVFNLENRIRIPRDSRILIQNNGLMGERMLTLDLGEGEDFYRDDELIIGDYEAGIAEAISMVGAVYEQAMGVISESGQIINKTLGSEQFSRFLKKTATRLGRINNRVQGLARLALILVGPLGMVSASRFC